jgi:CheY-like chemotaxis protein
MYLEETDVSGAVRPRILIVEDDPALTEMLQAYLSAQGYRILTSHLGAQAVDVATSHLPDLIILDINLPILTVSKCASAFGTTAARVILRSFFDRAEPASSSPAWAGAGQPRLHHQAL